MKAVMAFAGKAFAGKAAQQGGQAAAGASGGGASGNMLGNASQGMSVLASIMEYAGARQKAAAIDEEARGEEKASRQEYIQAAEKVNAIDARFNQLVGDQMVAAPAMGIDAGSGSVVAARNAARDEADRERKIIRTSAEANAAARKVRALWLREGAANARFGATVEMGMKLGAAFMGG